MGWLHWIHVPALGRRGERLAARHFKRLGYRIVARSYRTDLGEIDLIAARGKEIVFIEVKTRSSGRFGSPELAVGPSKRRRVTRLAVQFLTARKLSNVAVRFDIVAIVWPQGWFQKPALQHFEAAFQAEGPWSV